MKRMRFFLLIMVGLALAGCAHRHPFQPRPHPVKPPVLVVSPTTIPLVPFDKIVVSGQINVILHTGYKHPRLILRGDPGSIANTRVDVKNNTLIVNQGKHKGIVSVEIFATSFHSFDFKGQGMITGNNLNTSSLNIYIQNSDNTLLGGNITLRKLIVKGPGSVKITGVTANNLLLDMYGHPHIQLVGVANLSTLDLKGEGWFSMYWVKSYTLTIRARNQAKIQLAGIANKLDLELWGRAQFNGRYLRAKRVFAKTHNHSQAEIAATKRQHTLATDKSNIYFYNLPKMKTDFMAFDGSVLDMRDWRMFDYQEYNRYNRG